MKQLCIVPPSQDTQGANFDDVHVLYTFIILSWLHFGEARHDLIGRGHQAAQEGADVVLPLCFFTESLDIRC